VFANIVGATRINHDLQHLIIKRILFKIVHRTIVNMHSARKLKELEKMWCYATSIEDLQELFNEV
jgi:hypothetical protein